MMIAFAPGSPQVCSTRPECDALFRSLNAEAKAKSALQRAKRLALQSTPAAPAPRPAPMLPSAAEVYAARREGRTLGATPAPTTSPPARLLSAAEIYAQRRTDSQAAESGEQPTVAIAPRFL